MRTTIEREAVKAVEQAEARARVTPPTPPARERRFIVINGKEFEVMWP